jgi:hypothetical protein
LECKIVTSKLNININTCASWWAHIAYHRKNHFNSISDFADVSIEKDKDAGENIEHVRQVRQCHFRVSVRVEVYQRAPTSQLKNPLTFFHLLIHTYSKRGLKIGAARCDVV